VIALGSNLRRPLLDGDGNDRMIHSLESMSFLKADPENYIHFASQNMSKREIQIQYEYKEGDLGKEKDTNHFKNLYSVKINTITLRELLLFKSIYYCSTLRDINELIELQPQPKVFYKSFLELDCSNMISILAFDFRSMQALLKDDFAEYF